MAASRPMNECSPRAEGPAMSDRRPATSENPFGVSTAATASGSGVSVLRSKRLPIFPLRLLLYSSTALGEGARSCRRGRRRGRHPEGLLGRVQSPVVTADSEVVTEFLSVGYRCLRHKL